MDWIFHILVPLGLLALFGLRSKWVFLLLPLTVILDIGTVLNFRRGFHSIFVALAILAIIFVVCRLKKIPETKTILGISAFYLASHFLLDIGGPMALLWPFSGTAYTLTIEIVIKNLIPIFIFAVNAVPIGSLEQKTGALIGEAGFGLLFSFLIMLLAQKIFAKKKQIR
ncbi:MAG: hypothetical protein PHD95_06505 [Candidatus ainarchaeum sp.]|nr:hypothetical protein [Candidatus ainarchaeum sp.]